MSGYFITFEGGEGSGKTSVIESLNKYFTEKGFEVVVTREPGGIEIAEQIRNIILNKDNVQMDKLTEAYLFAASRRQHLVERVIPELEKGAIVLCDRFVDSSIVYQGYARDIGMDKVYDINKVVIGEFMPDLTLFFDVRPEIGLKRILDNLRKVNRLDLEEKDFHNKVYEGYQKLVKRFPSRIKVVDAEKNIEEVKQETIKIVEDFLDDLSKV
ncbi:dTMP kinase [Mycoplasmatota bacterium]|nr:dTMP kinase [Mycoplasmatota bacterium]